MKRQSGFTLIETLVAMTLMLIVVAAVMGALRMPPMRLNSSR